MIERIKNQNNKCHTLPLLRCLLFLHQFYGSYFIPHGSALFFSYGNDTIYTTLHLYVSNFMNVSLEGNDYGFLSSNIINKLSIKFSTEFELKHLDQKY